MPSSEAMRKAADEIAPLLLQTNVATSSEAAFQSADHIFARVPADFSVQIPERKKSYTESSAIAASAVTATTVPTPQSSRSYYSSSDASGDGDWRHDDGDYDDDNPSGYKKAAVKRRRIGSTRDE
jgi:hypothetical protein